MDKQEKQIEQWLSEGKYSLVRQQVNTEKKVSKEIEVLKCLFCIYDAEKENGIADTVFEHSKDLNTLVEHYIKTKLLLRRLEFDITGEEEFYSYCAEKKVSQYFIAQILFNNLLNAKKVCRKLIMEYSRRGSSYDKKVKYFQALWEQLED